MDPQHPSGESAPRVRTIPVPGAERYYRDIDQGTPIMVRHGGPSFDHHYLLPDLDRLTNTYRHIYCDQRGRGKSGGGVQPEDVTLTTEIAGLDAARAYLLLESVAALGHSWRGLLAMEYAIPYPERVSHLILLNTAPASHDDCVVFEGAHPRIPPRVCGER
jgi:proline iminopeptidase